MYTMMPLHMRSSINMLKLEDFKPRLGIRIIGLSWFLFLVAFLSHREFDLCKMIRYLRKTT